MGGKHDPTTGGKVRPAIDIEICLRKLRMVLTEDI